MSTSLTVIETPQTCRRRSVPTFTAAVDLAKAEKAPARARPTGPTSGYSRRGARQGRLRIAGGPETVAAFWRPRPATAQASTLAAAWPRSATLTSWRGSLLPTDAEGVKATCGAFAARVGAARVKKAPAVAAKVRAWSRWRPTVSRACGIARSCSWASAGAFRRSELVALDVADIEETETGPAGDDPAQQDRPGGRPALPLRLPAVTWPARQGAAGLAGCGRYRGRPDLPADRQGGHCATLAAYLPIGGQYRQGVRRTGRVRRQHVFRPFPPGGLPHLGSRQGRINLQDDGCLPAQVGGYPAGLRARCRAVQGSCGGGVALMLGMSASVRIVLQKSFCRSCQISEGRWRVIRVRI